MYCYKSAFPTPLFLLYFNLLWMDTAQLTPLLLDSYLSFKFQLKYLSPGSYPTSHPRQPQLSSGILLWVFILFLASIWPYPFDIIHMSALDCGPQRRRDLIYLSLYSEDLTYSLTTFRCPTTVFRIDLFCTPVWGLFACTSCSLSLTFFGPNHPERATLVHCLLRPPPAPTSLVCFDSWITVIDLFLLILGPHPSLWSQNSVYPSSVPLNANE